ncbi:MAG: ribonuclease R [Deferribacteraceae bacterium]|nr:ribonuclease R [Deferribacteraceae bacterium]
MKINRKEIIAVFKRANEPISIVSVAKAFKVEKKEIKIAIAPLLQDKTIIKYGKLYGLKGFNMPKQIDEEPRPVKKVSKVLKGRIEAHQDGYAFFIPDDSSREDLFISANKLNSAVHGDRVVAKKVIYKGKPEGHVLEILERGTTQIVGRVEVKRNHYVVIPFHRKFVHPIFISKREERYREDDVVLCSIHRYPDSYNDARGKIVKVLGRLDDKGIENLIVMNKYELSVDFPQEVQLAAEKAAADLPSGKDSTRKDFRKLFTVTIDGESAKDFDDAISLEKSPKGYTLYVHIADVSHYVQPDSSLDREAYRRGTSVYFPEFAIPMLPMVLSNGSCSLNPNADRYTMTIKISYNNKGERQSAEIYQSVIKSDYRLTYKYVNSVLAGDEVCEAELQTLIGNANELLTALKSRREKQGTIEFDLPEADFVFDVDGNIVEILPEERGVSERIIENFMIEANEVAAERIEKGLKYGIFRNHDKPDFSKLISWSKFAATFGVMAGKIPENIEPKSVQKLFQSINGGRAAYLLQSMLVRSMQRAEYSAENIGHFGLASECYTHFTSPIRRYPDLLVHRLLKYICFSEKLTVTEEKLDLMAKHCSTMERNADDAEREVHLYKKLAYIRNNSDMEFDAYINRISNNGLFVFLDKLMITGFIDITSLPRGRYYADIDGGMLTNKSGGIRYRLGDRVKVAWVSTDIDRLEAEFDLINE